MRQPLRVAAIAFIVVAAIFAFMGWGTERAILALVVGLEFAVVLIWLELQTRRR